MHEVKRHAATISPHSAENTIHDLFTMYAQIYTCYTHNITTNGLKKKSDLMIKALCGIVLNVEATWGVRLERWEVLGEGFFTRIIVISISILSWVGRTSMSPAPLALDVLALQLKPSLKAQENPLFTPTLFVWIQATQLSCRGSKFDWQRCADGTTIFDPFCRSVGAQSTTQTWHTDTLPLLIFPL